MIDLKKLADNLEDWQAALDKRGGKYDLKKVLEQATKFGQLVKELDDIRAQQNQAAKNKDIAEGKRLKELEVAKSKEIEKLNQGGQFLGDIPNIPLPDVPAGGEENNQILETVGEPPTIENAKDHIELGTGLNILDIERAAKTSGSRFYFLKNQAVELEFAMVRWVMDVLKKKGFELMVPPVMVDEKVMSAGGYLGKAANEVYRIANITNVSLINNTYQICSCGAPTTIATENDYIVKIYPNKPTVELSALCSSCAKEFRIPVDGTRSDLYLIGTSEQSMLGYHATEMIDVPKRYASFSTCFRREAGSYGQDVKGIIRTHQFDKVEMFSFVDPKTSDKELDLIVSIQEEILKNLEIPYQKVLLAAGDMGSPSAKTIDLESWLPSQKRYKETHSASNCTDWQADRAGIGFKKNGKSGGRVHTLNGTAVAIGRTLVALIENHQQPDGSIKIPKVLHPYLNFKEIRG